MRSWESRGDTFVVDEPLYAHYLQETGLDHPGPDEVIASQETDWRKVVDYLTGDVPEGMSVFYQKHMAHHLLPGIDREWVGQLRNAFLIRDPREMLSSLSKVTPNPTLEDTGLPQQVELFEQLSAAGETPPVIDARDVLENPRALLTKLCDALGVTFDKKMLSWKSGPRATDGVWAKHWYAAVEKSTGFQPYKPKSEEVPDRLWALFKKCQDNYYEVLYDHRLRAD